MTAKTCEQDVRKYLIAHPDFFDSNPDLLTLLKPTRKKWDDDVVDFQAILLDRLQNEVTALSDIQGSLVNASRSNMTTQARIHAAVLCLFEAQDYGHLCHIVCNDWVDLLQVDSITISFESLHHKHLLQCGDIQRLPQGLVNQYLGHENTVMLRGDIDATKEIFGPAKNLVKAEALIRIEKDDKLPVGILAFGSREKDFFTPGQCTELLRFLAACFQSHLKKILPTN